MDFRFYGIAELAIVVSDTEQAKEFHIGILGFEEMDNHAIEFWGWRTEESG